MISALTGICPFIWLRNIEIWPGSSANCSLPSCLAASSALFPYTGAAFAWRAEPVLAHEARSANAMHRMHTEPCASEPRAQSHSCSYSIRRAIYIDWYTTAIYRCHASKSINMEYSNIRNLRSCLHSAIKKECVVCCRHTGFPNQITLKDHYVGFNHLNVLP